MLPAMGEILNIVSSAAKSKRSPATVQSASLRPFRGGGGGGGRTPSQYGMGGVQALSQCLFWKVRSGTADKFRTYCSLIFCTHNFGLKIVKYNTP